MQVLFINRAQTNKTYVIKVTENKLNSSRWENSISWFWFG